MKLACFRGEPGGPVRVGEVDPVAGAVLEVRPAGDPLLEELGVMSLLHGQSTPGDTHSLEDVQLLAPIPRPPRNIFCVGKNYREHVLEFGRSGYDTSASVEVPQQPIVFTKAPSTVVGPGSSIDPHLDLTAELDYEGELAVIIGHGGRAISRDQAMSHVWGYTIVNDVTARDRQRDHKQWFLGKSLDTHCPMGPWAVTADEVDLATATIETSVNGELRQQANVSAMIFDIPALIECISAGITLEPGDIIATGTPAGVGVGFTPARFLHPGDLIEVTIDGIGTLRNRVGD